MPNGERGLLPIRTLQVCLSVLRKYKTLSQVYNVLEIPPRAHCFELELCPNGSLFDLMNARWARNRWFTALELVKFGVETLSGLSYLHGRTVLHLDLKPDNILIDGMHRYVLADFGRRVGHKSNLQLHA